MTRRKKLIMALACAGALTLIAVPVYAAACKMCKTAGGEIAQLFTSKNIDLTAAIAAAEKRSRGKALAADTTMEEGQLVFHVYCWASDNIVRIEVLEDGKTRGVEDAEALPAVHDPVAHKPKPSPSG